MAGLVARLVEEKKHVQDFGGKTKKKRLLGRPRRRGRIVLNWIKNWDCSNDRTDLVQRGTEGGII
jgi:hypothetical protein